MEGKLSLVDRQLLEDSLDEYRFYSKKITQLEQNIYQYIISNFPIELNLIY